MQEKKISHVKDSTSKKIITRRANGTLRVQTLNSDPSLTDPQWQEQSDINNIMEKFQKTGQLTHTSNRQGVYADVSNIPDLLGAAIIVRETQNRFDELPARVREKFNHNPQLMIDFLGDPKNQEEAVKLGLLTNISQPLNNDELNDDLKAKKSKKEVKQTEPPKIPDQE